MKNDELIFIEKHSVGIVSTCENGEPHGVPIYYHFNKEQEAFYFITKNKTKKYSNLEKNNKAFFTIFNEDPQVVFTAKCEVELLDCMESDCKEVIGSLIDVHSKQEYYPTPVEMLEEGSLRLVRLNTKEHKFVSYQKGV
jgi:uncharacterized pyridoxamine 5'-phosphate oxidase family protein